MERADEEGVCCEVIASDMGVPVYEACGFRDIESAEIRVPGEEETDEGWVMWRPERVWEGEGERIGEKMEKGLDGRVEEMVESA